MVHSRQTLLRRKVRGASRWAPSWALGSALSNATVAIANGFHGAPRGAAILPKRLHMAIGVQNEEVRRKAA